MTCRCITENSSPLQSHDEGFPGVMVLAFEKYLPWLLPSGGVVRVDTVRLHSSRDCVGCKYKLCVHDFMSAP